MSRQAFFHPLIAGTMWISLPTLAVAQQGDIARGRTLFQQQCAACHQITSQSSGVGPSLQGVANRPAGTAKGFNYSPSLKNSGKTWTAAELERFLADPMKAVPGVRMVQRVPSAQDRADIIQYLSTP